MVMDLLESGGLNELSVTLFHIYHITYLHILSPSNSNFETLGS